MKSHDPKKKIEFAVFGGGCFWCLEAVFAKLKGVKKVISGYAGGDPSDGTITPTYKEVCSGKTGYAEVVKIEYDPKQILFSDLLSIFFAMHDPTTPNRQGADTGSQYRSVILFDNKNQKKEATEFIKKLSEDKIFDKEIVTEVKPLTEFFPAEDHHQDYFSRNSHQPYCRINISPKIAKLRQKFNDLIK
jgi:peptide-methionine (S)-S-oxide reductase